VSGVSGRLKYSDRAVDIVLDSSDITSTSLQTGHAVFTGNAMIGAANVQFSVTALDDGAGDVEFGIDITGDLTYSSQLTFVTCGGASAALESVL
jgi:hypothetical protein